MTALIAAIALAGFGLLYLTARTQNQFRHLRTGLGRTESEALRIGDEFRDSLRRLNDLLYQYGRSEIPLNKEEFSAASQALDQWIETMKPKLATEPEQQILNQIDAAYDQYLGAAKALLAHLEAIGEVSAKIDDYLEVRAKAQDLFALGQSLSEAHLTSRSALLLQANQTINQLYALEMVSVSSLLLCGLALSWVVYRDLIAPMRRKLVASQLLVERSEKLASLGMLAAGVAHEIRNPLTAIKAALFLQQKKFSTGTQEHDDAKVVEREILRLERIVNDFLRFARPTEPVLTRIPVATPLREAADLLAPQMSKVRIQFVVEPIPELFCQADAAQIKQVLINLIQNAADAVGPNGTIKLRARTGHRVLNHQQRKVVILEVEDNGKGIPPELQKRLFDPFFTTKDTGTGLGLCIAAGIVQKHGGAFEYQTEVQRGTTFGIILPQVSA